MDEFDVIDFVYEAIEAAGTGIAIYKDKSEAGVKDEHIVINHLSLTELDFINKAPRWAATPAAMRSACP